jgi:diguanylate cyclase (GGDEF)-like protein
MIADNKNALLQQIKEQRFLPITEETPLLYEHYYNMIDSQNPDELAGILFYQGEYFFRIGELDQALGCFSRCLHAPKSENLVYLDAQAHNLTGLVYLNLGQESIALNDFLKCQTISEEHSLFHELTACCINLGSLYRELEDYDNALRYYDMAQSSTPSAKEDIYNLEVLCLACRGIIYCKLNRREELEQIRNALSLSMEKNDHLFYQAAVYNFNIRLYDFLQDKDYLLENLAKMIALSPANQDFMDQSEFYFDTCSYLLDNGMQQETRSLLDHMQECCAYTPVITLQDRIQEFEVKYARLFSSREAYLAACDQFIRIHEEYQSSQRSAKLYSLAYVERIRQAKNDSEIYLEKSKLDQMTGLFNKYTIRFLIEEDLSAKSPDSVSAMILIDLDHFKQINDTLGHLTGDALICQTAISIKNYFKDRAICGRIGGDEFLIYFSNVTDPSFVVLQAEILRQGIYQQISQHNITITGQASIGIAFSNEACSSYDTLFAAVDKALYRAKLEGRNKTVVANELG